jgi:hypothetical protein
MEPFGRDKFLDFIKYYNKTNPTQTAAFWELYDKVVALDPSLMTDDANWVRVYRSKPDTSKPDDGVLNVPYYSQRDNYRDANRTCFSSSCAMLCKFMKPDSINNDDDYIKEVFKRGDTTSSSVQVATLQYFGIYSSFSSVLSFSNLDAQLAKGIPVPIGILHHGPSSAPSGGGHWIIVIGKEVNASAPGGAYYIVNDPWGELDNASGTYISTNGSHLKYSKSMLTARWTPEGPTSGWGIVAKK